MADSTELAEPSATTLPVACNRCGQLTAATGQVVITPGPGLIPAAHLILTDFMAQRRDAHDCEGRTS